MRSGVRSLKSECDEIGVRRWRGAGSVVEEEGAASLAWEGETWEGSVNERVLSWSCQQSSYDVPTKHLHETQHKTIHSLQRSEHKMIIPGLRITELPIPGIFGGCGYHRVSSSRDKAWRRRYVRVASSHCREFGRREAHLLAILRVVADQLWS